MVNSCWFDTSSWPATDWGRGSGLYTGAFRETCRAPAGAMEEMEATAGMASARFRDATITRVEGSTIAAISIAARAGRESRTLLRAQRDCAAAKGDAPPVRDTEASRAERRSKEPSIHSAPGSATAKPALRAVPIFPYRAKRLEQLSQWAR